MRLQVPSDHPGLAATRVTSRACTALLRVCCAACGALTRSSVLWCAELCYSACARCLATYKEGSKTEIVLVEQGEGGFADLVAKLPDDGIRYGVCNYTSGGRRRTFFLSWIGEGVAGMARARAGMHRQGVLNAFEGIVGDVHATDRDEVSEDNVKAALAAAVGSSEIEL